MWDHSPRYLVGEGINPVAGAGEGGAAIMLRLDWGRCCASLRKGGCSHPANPTISRIRRLPSQNNRLRGGRSVGDAGP